MCLQASLMNEAGLRTTDMKLKSYTMQDASETARLGTEHIVGYLQTQASTVSIENVEDDVAYRAKDIDLIWSRESKGNFKKVLIEVKVDNYFHTGNYFFETFSNVEKNTPGCFIYSQADYFFYYFLGVEIHVIELGPVRSWFLEKLGEFPRKRTTTPVGGSFYHTEGRLVKRSYLKEALPNYVRVIKYSDRWSPSLDKLRV